MFLETTRERGIAGLAFGHADPASWVGAVISLPIGVSICVSLVTALFTVIGAVSGALGWPFFTRAPDA